MQKKLRKIYLTFYSLKKKNVKVVELNIRIVTVFLNIKTLKMI